MLSTSKPLSPQDCHALITGASSGLSRETALHPAEQGFQVIARVRRQEDGERLVNACPSGRASTLLIDVTDGESIGRVAAQVAEKVGDTELWGLVNNAGIYIPAPLGCTSSGLLWRQLEINPIGRPVVTRAILPLLRRGGAARLVNVTPGLGSVVIPYLGAYSATQFAKEGVSDALCRELVPMDIQVSVASPGTIWTPIWDKTVSKGERAPADVPGVVADPYRDTYPRLLQVNEDSVRNSATRPADVAVAVHAALAAAKPRTRYRVGTGVRHDTLLARLSPDSAIDGMLRPIVIATPAAKEEQCA